MITLRDVLEEVALEGLTGCRPADLWQRIQTRNATSISKEIKESIWKLLSDNSADVAMYMSTGGSSGLNEDRKCKPRGTKLSPSAISDPVTGERGMCCDYEERRDVSQSVCGMSLDEATEKWGDSLVIVASKDLRLSSLVGPYCDPCCVLFDLEYIALEAIGKCRSEGITRIDLARTLGIDAKGAFHSVRNLASKRLIKQRKEVIERRLTTRIYLTRFYRETGDGGQLLTSSRKRVCDFLDKQPDKTADYREIESSVFSNSNLLDFKRARGWLVRNGIVKRLEPLDRSSNSLTLIKPFPDSDNDEDASDMEDPSLEQTSDCLREPVSQGRVYPRRWMDDETIAEESLLTQLYQQVEAAGSQGISQKELVSHNGVTKSSTRNGVRLLQNMGVLGYFVEDKGRQQIERYKALLPLRKSTAENPNKSESDSQLEANTSSQSLDESQVDPDMAASATPTLTPRMGGQALMMNRKAWLKEFVERHRVVHGMTCIWQGLREHETEHGRTHSICKKTVAGLVSQLIKAGEIDTVTTELFGQGRRFYMKKGVTTADEVFQDVVHSLRLSFDPKEKTKMKKLKAGTKGKMAKTKQEPVEEMENADVEKLLMESHVEGLVDSASIERLQEGISHQPVTVPEKQTSNSEQMDQTVSSHPEQNACSSEPQMHAQRQFKLKPKFHRLGTLHKYLWHGLHRSSGESDSSCLLPSSSRGDGWVLLSVALNWIPLQSFMESVGFVGKSSELEKFLEDPENGKTAIKDLPASLIQLVCAKHLNVQKAMYELAKNLEGMGLLAVEAKLSSNPYSTVHLSVERSAVLMDTRTANPAYCQLLWAEVKLLPRMEYLFQKMSDVNRFWFDLERVCDVTRLGKQSHKSKREKTETIVKWHGPVEKINFEQLQDEDVVGAAGLPWRFYAHLHRNWAHQIHQHTTAASTAHPEQRTSKKVKKVKESKQPKKVRVVVPPGRKFNEENRGGKGQKRHLTGATGNVAKRKKVLKKVQRVKKKSDPRSKVIRDTRDQEAQLKKRRLRVRFSKLEDNVIIICGAAKDFVKKHFRYDPSWVEIRNIYQEVAGLVACDKTSFAIQRRLSYIRRMSPSSARKLQTVLLELDQEQELRNGPQKSQDECLKTFRELVLKLWRKHGEKLVLPVPSLKADVPVLPESFAQLLAEYDVHFDCKTGGKDTKDVAPDDSDPVSVSRSVLRDLLLSVYAKSDNEVDYSSHQLYKLLNSYPEELVMAVNKELREKNYLVKTKRNSKVEDSLHRGYLTQGSSYHQLFPFHYPQELFSDVFDIDSLPHTSVASSSRNTSLATEEAQVAIEQDQIFNKAEDQDNPETEQQSITDHAVSSILDLSRMNGSCVASLLPKIFTAQVDVDVHLPEVLFDSVGDSDVKSSGKSVIEVDVSSEDEESRNGDSKKDRHTWTESLQEHLHVSLDHVEANNSLITISSCVTLAEQLEKDGSSDCCGVSRDAYTVHVPDWFMEVTVDAGFEDTCMSENELIAACQDMGWQSMEIADLLIVLHEVTQNGWQGIETQLLMDGNTKESLQSSIPIGTLIQTLLNFGMLHKVGFATERLVCHKACHCWHFEATHRNLKDKSAGSNVEGHCLDSAPSLATCSSTREANSKHLVSPRPWITCSGVLNTHQLTHLLQAVLNQIMWRPGITKDAVQRAIGGVIHPTAIDELLHFLEISHCITVQAMQQPKKTTLFSSPQALLPGSSDPSRCISHLFATADCVSQLATVLKA